jgi:starch synthase
MPSLYEPCGLGQMMAMRYGTIPVVRNTGGLSDTVNSNLGFKFNDFSSTHFSLALKKALNLYYNNKVGWNRMIQNGMKEDFSWNKSAKKYLEMYNIIKEEKK